MLGLPPPEIVDVNSVDLLHPDDRPILPGHLSDLNHGDKMSDQELRLRHGGRIQDLFLLVGPALTGRPGFLLRGT